MSKPPPVSLSLYTVGHGRRHLKNLLPPVFHSSDPFLDPQLALLRTSLFLSHARLLFPLLFLIRSPAANAAHISYTECEIRQSYKVKLEPSCFTTQKVTIFFLHSCETVCLAKIVPPPRKFLLDRSRLLLSPTRPGPARPGPARHPHPYPGEEPWLQSQKTENKGRGRY